MNSNKRYRGAIAAAILCLSAITIWGCHKKDSGTFTYTVTTLHDTSIEQGKNGVLYFNITKLSGASQYVTVAATDTIPGIHATVAPNKALAPFISAVGLIMAENATPKEFDYTVTTSTDGQPNQTYTTHITVLDCILARVGNYKVTSSCDTINHYSLVTVNPGSFHRINIANFANFGGTVYADVTCSKDSVSIPAQPLLTPSGVFTLVGTGDSKDTLMTIRYKLMLGDSIVRTCQENYSR